MKLKQKERFIKWIRQLLEEVMIIKIEQKGVVVYMETLALISMFARIGIIDLRLQKIILRKNEKKQYFFLNFNWNGSIIIMNF